MKDSKLHRHETEQPALFLEAHITQHQLSLGHIAEARPAVVKQRAQLESLNGVSHLPSTVPPRPPPLTLLSTTNRNPALSALETSRASCSTVHARFSCLGRVRAGPATALIVSELEKKRAKSSFGDDVVGPSGGGGCEAPCGSWLCRVTRRRWIRRCRRRSIARQACCTRRRATTRTFTRRLCSTSPSSPPTTCPTNLNWWRPHAPDSHRLGAHAYGAAACSCRGLGSDVRASMLPQSAAALLHTVG